MSSSGTYGQSLFAPRAIGLGAYGAMVKDSRGFVANPAGLIGMKDWDFNTTTYAPLGSRGKGFVFHGFGLGKRLFENDVVALQYSPGTSIKFVVPPRLTPEGSNDQEIVYDEPFATGYAHRFSNALALGISGRLREEKVIDTQYKFDFQIQDSIPLSITSETYRRSSWNIDVGFFWYPSERVTLTAVGRAIIKIHAGSLPGDFSALRLPNRRSAEIGVAYELSSPVHISAEVSTEKTGALGFEWAPGHSLALRSGVYFSESESPFAYAVGAGLGWSYNFFELDASYLRFVNQSRRSGSSLAGEFDPKEIGNLNLSPYTSDRLSLSIKVIFGSIRESLARIEGVEMLGGVYPSSYQVLAYRSIGKVWVRNISEQPIQGKASFYVEKYMDAPTETQSVYIIPGEVKEIQLHAVFNELVKRVPTSTIHDGNVYFSATPVHDYDDRVQTRVIIHGKNDWDGDVFSLRYFVAPDEPGVLRYSRDVLLQYKDSLAGGHQELEDFMKAKILFDGFAGKLLYVGDPKQSTDFVQYPSETLQIRGGDCDDMTVCFASLLSSVGISTAFVDVVPPDRPEKSHIYMLFDTGLQSKFGSYISDNPKRYIIRKNPKGIETIWIPIETTVITRGFEEAWTSGAQEYFDDVEIGLGLVKGWVKIVDVN